MTYGVPYSFVPGTKAKANEVNANFIDVLNKIEDTNLRIDDSNSKIDTVNSDLTAKIDETAEQKLNLDLSNISSAGQKLFDAKANASLLDGTWIYKYSVLVSDKSIDNNVVHTYSISSYLPDTTNKYQILASIAATPKNTTDSAIFLYLKTDFLTNYIPFARAATRHNTNCYTEGQAIIISSTGRKLYVWNTNNAINAGTYTLAVHAYRKVR